MHVMQGRLEEAQESASRALSEDAGSPQALMAGVYIEMRKGNSDAALRMLKARRAGRDAV